MWRKLSCTFVGALVYSVSVSAAERPKTYDELIARQAEIHGVPESFVHRIVKRESRYNPRVVHQHCFGLMQIKIATAREMGYKGEAKGLLDPKINLTYAVPYLANAYRLADGDEDRAVTLFSAGYYYTARQKNMLSALRTASSPPVVPEIKAQPAESAEPQNPLAEVFSFLAPQQQAAEPQQISALQ
ncbi:lytic transglycosylase domain-containing protein [Methylocapsa acidiphila]|uniref:lytic transglycosylase domain-containing protein n=1 Tax=Methylocapsa acidiphila TaxID=133552 RepID=UPI0004189B41|nr:lytic transglycosylase domain-containing protein [Methylocapsa acidiphila]